ncbi:flagellar basal-body MS-ring/collar protein FliF [Mesoterricola sediminis]|uniref:Flagellar M-ring protein n=1 Tax=Mesoterricola sediminis TaxID=2927980 RepID=A0AA48GTK1_9BACT|nr:flagellar basal-body MS-ring/collar protein FliF [Mesoterricola sediminis]BDU77484.1 flagellar M-ring protein [Mesoterricola sediminis]
MADEPSVTQQFTQALENMTATQKGMVAAICLTALLVLAGLGIFASQETMGVLFSNLPPTDANRIVEELKKQNIKYELSQDQRTVSVPAKRVGDLRLKFAGDGLPQGEGIGFDKLENPGLTTTDFTQKILYRRALEGTLADTIKSLQQVAGATVHITPQNDSPFATEKEEAKASVLLKLKGGRALPDENTQAIVNLVAASVEGLKPEQVVVIDQFSRILSRTGRDPMVGASDTQKKAQREEEEHLVRQVTELLEPVVGIGKVRVTARVDLDFDKVKTNSEIFDPAGQVERSVKTLKEEENKRDGVAGVPGTPSNVPPINQGTPGQPGTDTKKKEETTTQYEISKTLKSVEQAPGNVRRLSLAVIVDDASKWEKDPKGNPVEKTAPRTAEELKKIGDQVAAAVGVDPKRGDKITVENMPFAPTTNPREEAEAKKQFWIDQGKQALPFVLYSILGLTVFFLIILPMLKRISAALNRPAPLRVRVGGGEAGEGGAAAPRKFTPVKSMAELEAEIEAELNAEGASSAPEAQRRSLIKKRIQESTLGDAETIASLVRSWMIEDGR